MTTSLSALASAQLPLPSPRGPFTDHVLGHLTGIVPDLPAAPEEVGHDDADLQQALWLLNVVQVGDHPAFVPAAVSSIATRTLHWQMEQLFERTVRGSTGPARTDDLGACLDQILDRPTVDAVSAASSIGPGAVRDLLVAKAPYLGFEADPHTLTLAALEPALQHVVAEIQAGEYGVGFDRTHAQIYRGCLDALGMTYADAIEAAPTASFADANLTWLFARDRRWRGASVGQLCLFELDSVKPCRRYVEAWNEACLPEGGRRWYDVHVMADAEHEEIIRTRLIATIERETPWLVDDAAFGAEASWISQQRVALELMQGWSNSPAASTAA